MKVVLDPAFILHSRPYRETSLLLDAFTHDNGRVSLIAKGVRKKNNRKAELLQPYQRVLISWSGKRELMTLTTIEADKAAYLLTKDTLITGFYLNELITRLLHHHEAHPELFDVYEKTLKLISEDKINVQNIIRIFEKRLLEAVGYGMILENDVVTGEKIDADKYYYYQADHGPTNTLPTNADYRKVSGRTLIELGNESIRSGDTLNEARTLMRYVLQKYLGPKPLLSRELYRSFLTNTKPEL